MLSTTYTSVATDDVNIGEIEKSFADEVADIVKEAVDNTITVSSTYAHGKVAVWVNQIVDGVMKKYVAFSRCSCCISFSYHQMHGF